MAKWSGKVGFVVPKETSDQPGVWIESPPVERTYYGDFNRISRRLQNSDGLNDNVVIANELSIIADPFANENFMWIRYVTYMGTKWKVSNIQVQYPRLIFTLGDLYNG